MTATMTSSLRMRRGGGTAAVDIADHDSAAPHAFRQTRALEGRVDLGGLHGRGRPRLPGGWEISAWT